MSDSSESYSYQPADESKYSIEEELKWLLNYANHKFDVEKLKQFILAAKSQSKEKGTIDNKKTTLDIWNSVAFHLMHYENESEKDSSVGQRFDFVGENKIDIKDFTYNLNNINNFCDDIKNKTFQLLKYIKKFKIERQKSKVDTKVLCHLCLVNI